MDRLLASPEGRRKVFPMIVNQYSRPLYWKIRGIVLTHDDADDVLQNTFLKAWKNLPSFEGKAKLSTWLYRIAINEALDFLLLADTYFDGDRSQALLQEAVATLPDVQRTMFTLRYYDEMKYSEISEVLGTSEGALKASYHIAVQKITDYVKRHE